PLEPVHVRVIWEESPATQATFSWTTTDAGQSHAVRLATTSQKDNPAPAWERTVDVAETALYDDDAGAHYHHVFVDNLTPSTTYHFVVETDGEVSEERWFTTAPVDDRRVKLLYGGDSRSDWEDRRQMNRRMAILLQDDPEILALWHGGDFISAGSAWGAWAPWLAGHQLTTTSEGRILPIIPTRGNHERDGELYNAVFSTPGADVDSNYFATQMGSTARLITLDSEGSVFGDQIAWLERELIASQDSTWLLAGYHTPAYPAVKIAGPAKNWVPLFERYNVDLVCENDGHALKRTVPIRDEKMDPTGVVYVGEGGLGVKQREPQGTQWYLQEPGQSMSAHHVQVLTFEPDKLTYQAIGMDGAELDTYERTPRQR
ncbi:unnamed protein product, partial [Laminaria digitata]